jgi:riboflavin transporter FmnP
MEMSKERFFTSSKIAKAGIFSALSFILYMFVKFPLPLFPNFLEINFSDLPALIGGFMLGPIYGGIIVLIKVLIKLPFSSTQCVGELADLLIGWAYIIPAAIIYKKHKNIKGAVLGLVIGSILSIAMAMIANRLILIPFFSLVWGFDAIVGMCQIIFPNITNANFYNYYIFLSILPFNILRCLIASFLTFLLYKKISKIMSRM